MLERSLRAEERVDLKRAVLLLVVALALLAGCSKGAPKAVTGENEHDFGDVPVSNDMSQAKLKEFVIANDGTADLRLSSVQVEVREGC